MDNLKKKKYIYILPFNTSFGQSILKERCSKIMACFCVPLTPSLLLFLLWHCCNAPTWYLPLRDASPFVQPATPGDNFLHVWHSLGDLLSLLHPVQPGQWHKTLDCLQTESKDKTKLVIKIKTYQNKTFTWGYPRCFHLPSPAWHVMRKAQKGGDFVTFRLWNTIPYIWASEGPLLLLLQFTVIWRTQDWRIQLIAHADKMPLGRAVGGRFDIFWSREYKLHLKQGNSW